MKFKLLKDLPGIPAGSIGETNSLSIVKFGSYEYTKTYCQQNDDWFEQQKDIKIGDWVLRTASGYIDRVIDVNDNRITTENTMEFPIVDIRLATHSEIFEHLQEKAKQLSFEYQTSFKPVRPMYQGERYEEYQMLRGDNKEKVGKVGSSVWYNIETDTFVTYGFGAFVLYEKGVWAKPIKPSVSLGNHRVVVSNNTVTIGCKTFSTTDVLVLADILKKFEITTFDTNGYTIDKDKVRKVLDLIGDK